MNLTVACTLSPADRPERLGRLAAVLRAVRARAELPDGVTLQFEPAPDLAHELLDLLLAEQRCCAFLHFALEIGTGVDGLTLQVRSPAGPEAVRGWLAAIDVVV